MAHAPQAVCTAAPFLLYAAPVNTFGMKHLRVSALPAFLSLALFSASGCGKDAPAQIQQELPDPAPTQASSLSDAIRQMDNANVFCENEETCVPGVALLVAAHTDHLESCTGFIVSNRILMTHRGCLPVELRRAGASCAGRVRALFPSSSEARAETIDCDRVLSVSDPIDPENLAGLDYAFLSLKTPAARKPLKISTNGIDAMNLSVVRFEPTSVSNPIGKIAKVDCKSVQRTQDLPSYVDSDSPVVTLAGCDTPLGSGGAPVIDLSGQVRGLLQPPTANSASQARVRDVSPPPVVISISFATNLSCISGPVSDLNKMPPVGCLDVPSRASFQNDNQQNVAHLETKIRTQLDDKAAQWQPGGSSANVIRWKLASRPSPDKSAPSSILDTQYYAVPDCFFDSTNWFKRFRIALGFEVKKHATLEFQLPIWHVILSQNSVLQNELQIVQLNTPAPNAILDFNPKEVHKYQAGMVSFSVQSEGIQFSGKLKQCTGNKD